MYCPKPFEETRPEVLHRLVHDHPLGLLVTQGPQHTLDANPLPFLLHTDADGRTVLRAHVARANPVWREAQPDAEAMVVFQGPQAYVSPGWYPGKAEHGKVVPTWNYIVVQARGRLAVHDDRAWLHDLVTQLTQRHEARQPAPWAVSDAPPDYLHTMLGAIVGIEITLTSLVGKCKLSQNHASAQREGVIHGLRRAGGEQNDAVAGWMAGDLPG